MRLSTIIGVAVLACGCENGGTTGTDGGGDTLSTVACAIVSPAADAVVHDTVAVRVEFTGPVAHVQVLAGGTVVAETDVPEGSTDPVDLEWNSTAAADGAVDLTAHVSAADGAEGTSAALAVDVDNTAPVAAFGVDRFALVRGDATVALDIDEPHVSSIRVSARLDETTTEVFAATEEAAEFAWDVTEEADRVHWMKLEVDDAAGHHAEVVDFPLIVANNGEEYEVEYDPAARVFVPVDYEEVEYHTRASVPTHEGVYRLISWLTWDAEASPGWLLQFSIGEGLCPHRGISFADTEGDGGELLLELARDELPTAVVNRFDAEYRTMTTFPSNDDPLTYGTFFGHVSPLEPADHVDQTLPIEIHYVLIDEAES
jgi:hypothetical protein